MAYVCRGTPGARVCVCVCVIGTDKNLLVCGREYHACPDHVGREQTAKHRPELPVSLPPALSE